jgi:hypothetical protein
MTSLGRCVSFVANEPLYQEAPGSSVGHREAAFVSPPVLGKASGANKHHRSFVLRPCLYEKRCFVSAVSGPPCPRVLPCSRRGCNAEGYVPRS